jgi:DNA-binding PadR family transcriptional regulator
MFGRRFAYQFEAAFGGPWAQMHGWWQGRRGRPGPRLFGWQMRRNPFGRGGPFGPGGPFDEEGFPGFPGGGKRFFGRGDLKFALLELLQERPMHGYEMMKELQERTNGMYTPSAGSVYPTLQMLEDRGFVTVSEVDGKKVYSITDAGRAFLAEEQPEERGGSRRGFWHASEEDWATMGVLMQELREFGPLAGRVLRSAVHDPKKLKRLRKLLAKMRAELLEIAGEESPSEG